jgi:hypothetical protein
MRQRVRSRLRSISIAGSLAGSSLFLVTVLGACSSSSSSSGTTQSFPPNSAEYTGPDGSIAALESPGTCSGATGGAVAGPDDNHCVDPDGGLIIQPTTAAGCTDMTAPPASDAGDTGDGGSSPTGDPCPGDMNAYGAVMYNTQGSDDDCKYDVAWQSTPICQGQPVYFTVVVTKRENGEPLLGVETGGSFVPANPRPDVVLACDHPIPNTPAPRDPSPSVAPGVYVVGPVVFDKSGDWVFRFHFNEECLDIADDSPHGHAAFHINVP